MIKLHNTKTRRKEAFVPIDDQNVRMYVCGPTVYDRAHLGNARPVVVFDVLYRLLRHVYGEGHVTYVRNFTDVDDKINAKAAETGRDIREITDETIGWFLDDMDALGAMRPDHAPRATEYIGPMVAMIVSLIEKGHAYASEGHVLFDVNSYDAYGALSGRKLEDMRAGERVEVADYKRDPMDFVLWKPSSGKQPGWESPWGFGRPGWHIECSAMSLKLLGESFDIHGGGLDLQFPHHENEIAQSCCANPHGDFARYWLHNEMLQVEGKKMSKSLGNFFTVRDLLDEGVPGEVIRFVLLSTHYRSPMDWTDKKMKEAEKTLRRWRTLTVNSKANPSPEVDAVEALSDDLNTHGVLSVLHRLASNGNGSALLASAKLVGLLEPELGDWFVFGDVSISGDERIDNIIAIRASFRSDGDYQTADKIKAKLSEIGVVIMDYRNNVSTGYFEPTLASKTIISNAWKAWKGGNKNLASAHIALAKTAGIKIHLDSTHGPSATTGHDYKIAREHFENQIDDIIKFAEALE